MTRFQYQNGDRPLDGYTIEYALGRGGFGEVYFAVSDAGRQVALKAVQNYEEIELRGIGHCMNLKSQHLVSIFDVRKGADGTPWVIMEFVAGPSLRDILDQSPEGIGPEKASFFVCELAKGLTYLHGAGVVHRDLKPHNVFFEEGIVKIGDYSLSKVITTSHRSGHTMTVGTVHYMAPEIGMGRYDKTVDIYALGVMLYEMLTGSPPYTGDSMGEVLMKHLSAEPDVSKIDEPFASVIKISMQRDPANRYQTAEEMAAALQGIDQVAGSMTGFGPASLSIVADRAAKKARPASEDSTGRVDPALTATQAERPVIAGDHVPPTRRLGPELGRLAYHAAIVRDCITLNRVAKLADSVAPWQRLTLAISTLLVMSAVGGTMMLGLGSSGNSYLIDGKLGPMLSIPNFYVQPMLVILIPLLTIMVGAVIVRSLIDRGILDERPTRCRIAHVAISLGALTCLLLMSVRPITYFVIANLLAVGLPLLIQNWCLLTSPTRSQRIRLSPVLFAAIIVFLTAEILGADSMFAVAVSTGSSLAVQVWARFSPCDSNQAPDQGQSAEASVGPQPELAATQPPIHSLVTAE